MSYSIQKLNLSQSSQIKNYAIFFLFKNYMRCRNETNSMMCPKKVIHSFNMYIIREVKLTLKKRFFSTSQADIPILCKCIDKRLKRKIWCGTHTAFSYVALQQNNILLSALHSYLIFISYALQFVNYLLLHLLS